MSPDPGHQHLISNKIAYHCIRGHSNQLTINHHSIDRLHYQANNYYLVFTYHSFEYSQPLPEVTTEVPGKYASD
jgi:hypothetical protein